MSTSLTEQNSLGLGAFIRTGRGLLVQLLWLLAAGLVAPSALAQETICARVKIEIKQELTLERQAFDAEMKINNTTDTSLIENVAVVVKVTDELGVPVLISSDANDSNAKFFVRVSSKQNISDVEGTGTVNPKTTSVIDWLLIPAPGAAGTNPFGKKYLVGATLTYKFGGEVHVMEVDPDVITVKPLPLLSLDYFLPEDVLADDPLTAEVEPIVPFTLGVRVKNNGFATAKNLKIDSAQPKIIENKQGLLINFTLTGSYVNDAPTQKTLLVDFGDIAAGTSKMGRWNMETTLAGKFTEFTAKFSHADELGGAMTSILQATNAHFLIRDVRVDLPGRDMVRDFLAKDGDVIRLYESDGPDTEVTDRSSVASFTAGAGSNGNASYKLSFPATAGFAYVKLPDPYNGTKALGKIVRSDAKALSVENVWLSQTRNAQTKKWEYWINFFDVNTTGQYDSEFQAPPPAAQTPVIQFIPDRVTKEGKQVSFLVEASSPDGRPVTLSAAPLPAGASFTAEAADPASPKLSRAIFDWTPPKGTAGKYLVTYTVTDGTLSAARSASITVEADTPPPGPGTPSIEAPLAGAQVTNLKPTLSVLSSGNAQDPTTQVQFEVYADEAATQLVASALVAKAAPTAWQLPNALNDNTRYWWRARGFDGTLYSAWINGSFFVNTFNDPPDSFNPTNPVPGAEVASLTPELAWTNSADKDGDVITYSVALYSDAALTQVLSQTADLPQDASGSTRWTVTTPLSNHVTYYYFPEVYVATVRATERTGDLPQALARYIAYEIQFEAIRKKLVSASIYPAMLFLVGGFVTLFLLGYVVPRFATVYESSGRQMPWLSSLLIGFGKFIHGHWQLALLAVVATVAVLMWGLFQPKGRAWLLAQVLSLPWLAQRANEFRLGRFYRAVSLLLAAGIALPRAMGMVTGLLSRVQQTRLAECRLAIEQGQSLSIALVAASLASPVAESLIKVGERSGQMAEMLERTARFVDEDLARWVDWASRLLEPILMTVIGLVIGTVVVLMYLPIFELAGSLQ